MQSCFNTSVSYTSGCDDSSYGAQPDSAYPLSQLEDFHAAYLADFQQRPDPPMSGVESVEHMIPHIPHYHPPQSAFYTQSNASLLDYELDSLYLQHFDGQGGVHAGYHHLPAEESHLFSALVESDNIGWVAPMPDGTVTTSHSFHGNAISPTGILFADANIPSGTPTLGEYLAPRIDVLPQHLYTGGIHRKGAHRSNPELPTCEYGPFGYSLTRILRKDFGGMPDHTKRAFPKTDMGQKCSVRFEFTEYPFRPRRNTQNNVLTTRRDRGAIQPSKARIAYVCANAFNRYFKYCESVRRPLPYRWEDFVLLDVKFVSKGSLQPEIGVLIRTYANVEVNA